MKKTEETAEKMISLVNVMLAYKNKYFKAPITFKPSRDTSERQFVIMINLWLLKKSTVTYLADTMKISKSTLSIILNKMEEKNLIVKEYPSADNADKRKVFLYLSETGHERLKEVREKEFLEFKKMYSTFSDEQKQLLIEGLDKIIGITDEDQFLFFKPIYKEYCRVSNTSDEIENIYMKVITFFSGIIEQQKEFMRFDTGLPDGMTITKNQLYIMHCIGNLNLNTITKLEKHLYSSGSTVSIGVSKLVQKGYLQKRYAADNADKRIVHISLTKTGEKVLTAAKEKIREGFVKYVNSFQEDSIEIMNKALNQLLKVFI